MPAPSVQGSARTRIDTPAAERAAHKLAAERGCERELMELMKSAPDAPTSKAVLRPKYPKLSERAFEVRLPKPHETLAAPRGQKGGATGSLEVIFVNVLSSISVYFFPLTKSPHLSELACGDIRQTRGIAA